MNRVARLVRRADRIQALANELGAGAITVVRIGELDDDTGAIERLPQHSSVTIECAE